MVVMESPTSTMPIDNCPEPSIQTRTRGLKRLGSMIPKLLTAFSFARRTTLSSDWGRRQRTIDPMGGVVALFWCVGSREPCSG